MPYDAVHSQTKWSPAFHERPRCRSYRRWPCISKLQGFWSIWTSTYRTNLKRWSVPSTSLEADVELLESKLGSQLTKHHVGVTLNLNIIQNQNTLSVYSRIKQMHNRILEQSYYRMSYLNSKLKLECVGYKEPSNPECRTRLNYWTSELPPSDSNWNPEEEPQFFYV